MPATTRSRTGRLPPPPPPMAGDVGSDVDDNDAGPSDKRPAKRARTSTAGKAKKPPTGLSKRKQGRLSALPTMPLDILFEIFSHLLPADLVQLSRVSKAFRQVLLSRRSAFLWKGSYSHIPGTPTCPKDMSEPAWANLLFGGSFCHTCGAKPVNKILFMLRRRACNACLTNHLLSGSNQVEMRYPGVPGCVLELLPYTTEGPKIRGRSWYGRHWWDEDIEALQKEIDALEQRCEQGNPQDYEKAIQEFTLLKKKQLEDRKEHTNKCVLWTSKKEDERFTELQSIKDKRYADIEARCLQLGYTKADVARIRTHREIRSGKPMSNRVWQRIWPILQPCLDKARADRLLVERNRRRRSREELVAELYIEFLKTRPPKTVPYLPSERDVLQLDSISAAIEEDTIVTQELRQTLTEIIPNLMPQLEAWTDERKLALLSKLPSPEELAIGTSDSAKATSSEDAPITDPMSRLQLATSVFTCNVGFTCRRYGGFGCSNAQILVGSEAVAHRCSFLTEQPRDSTPALPHFSEKGSRGVRDLVVMLGLDPSTATPTDLDRLDPRFVCMKCPSSPVYAPFNFPGNLRRKAMSWRACIEHILYGPSTNHADVEWAQLNEDETRDVKAREGSSLNNANDVRWGCGHCSAHIERHKSLSHWMARNEAVLHVQEAHGIAEPQESEDYWWNPRYYQRFPSFTTYDLSDSEDDDDGMGFWFGGGYDEDEDMMFDDEEEDFADEDGFPDFPLFSTAILGLMAASL